MVIGSDSGTARSVSSRERSSRLPGSVFFCPFWVNREGERNDTGSSQQSAHVVDAPGRRGSTCRATSAEAGLKPKPVGAFSSSSTPLTPGLK